MTVDEFDIRFDILFNNIASNAAPALTAYEKSVFLSQAQRDIIVELYTGKNNIGISFESTEEAREYLRNITVQKSFSLDKDTLKESTEQKIKGSDKEYYIVDKDSDIWFITYEEAYSSDNKNYIVVPIKQDAIYSAFKNPFKGPSGNRVLRVNMEGTIYLYSKNNIDKYSIVYIKKPSPIILKDVDDITLTIDGVKCNVPSVGNAPDVLHQYILDRAVALAKQTYINQ